MPTQDLTSMAIGIGTKAAKSNLRKMIIEDAIDYVLTTYKELTNKIKNKKATAMLDAGVEEYIVNRGIDSVGELFN